MIIIKRRKILFISLFFVLFLTSVPLGFVRALEINYPTFGGIKPTTECGFPQYALYVFKMIISLSGLVVFAVLVWSGFIYLMSGDDANKKVEAKNKATGAFRGLMILLISYIFLNLINPQLTIFKLPCTSATPNNLNNQNPSSSSKTNTFQEIPLGTIIENMLAGNSPTTSDSKTKCYEYDPDGNTKDINGDNKIDEKDLLNYNSFYCIKLINQAFETKVNKFLASTTGLEDLMKEGCKCTSCSKYPFSKYPQDCESKYPSSCKKNCCNVCVSHCQCCGSARGKNPGCVGTDPCSNRTDIDCQRQQLKQLIDGGALVDENGKTNPCYDKNLDPANNSKITTLQELENRMEAFSKLFKTQLSDLKEAERLMKTPYGKRLTLAEYLNIKEKSQASVKIDKTIFKNYDVSEYCQEFKCTAIDTQGLCISCELNTNNRSCKIKNKTEDYSLSGDGAAFYYNDAFKDEAILTQEKCTVEPATDTRSIAKGLIPIGETVDETEKLGDRMAALYDLLIANYQNTIKSISNIYNYPEQCDCSNCGNRTLCQTRCNCEDGCCDESCRGCTDCEPNKKTGGTRLVSCSFLLLCCERNVELPIAKPDYYVCPIDEYEQEFKKIYNDKVNESDYRCCNYSTTTSGDLVADMATTTSWKATTTYDGVTIVPAETLGYSQIIKKVIQRINDLFNPNDNNLDPGEPNKCTILDKLSDSRKKLDECITGFGSTLQEEMTPMRTLSCQSSLDLVYLGKLVIESSTSTAPDYNYLNCYPFVGSGLTDSQSKVCFKNKDSAECQNNIKSLLDNYYCCEGK